MSGAEEAMCAQRVSSSNRTQVRDEVLEHDARGSSSRASSSGGSKRISSGDLVSNSNEVPKCAFNREIEAPLDSSKRSSNLSERAQVDIDGASSSKKIEARDEQFCGRSAVTLELDR